MGRWGITDTIIMGVRETITEKSDDGTVRYTVITDEGHASTGSYNQNYHSDGTINDVISKTTEDALSKD